ncbi:hypothetical protein [Eikenella corrodens]|uniref:hypothetical protein n=1 Tax=Eikenella corrodens TaxID=539 RepID=UPI00129BADA3|nr:hypothetical protein [Eikenella corrodens]
MITLRDITQLIAMLYWGTMLVCALGSIFLCYKAQPKFLKKYPWLLPAPGLVVAALFFLFPKALVWQEEQENAEKVAEWRKRYDPAKASFDQLCQNAGEKIYRTADNVDGILLLKVRGDDEKYQSNRYNPLKDQMWEDAAVESESKRERYIEEFLLRSNLSFPRYIYADVLQKDNSIIRYSIYKVNQEWVEDKQLNPHPRARYAVTYENDISWENRKHWIAGTTIKIIDTKTNELMAEKTMYAFVPELGYSKFEQNPNPWGRGMRCPAGESEFEQRTVTFAIKVLIPSNLSRRLQND